MMAMPPERSRPLHNFTLPQLRWANQRFLRCMKLNTNNAGAGATSTSTSATNRRSDVQTRPGKEMMIKPRSFDSFKKPPLSPIGHVDSNGISAVREKLMLDLRVAADMMKFSILEEKEKELRPCNLRTRRAACNEPNESGTGGGCNKGTTNSSNPFKPTETPASAAAAAVKSTRLRGLAAEATTSSKQSLENGEKMYKLCIPLSREEIESDFLAMTGKRPARRPKKRPRTVQRQLDFVFPATWLTEVTPETYKVPDVPESGGKASR